MRKPTIHTFFKHTEHPDESILWLYSRGELSRKDMHRVEQHLIDCPMCRDLVEGYGMYESESSFNASKNRTFLSFERSLKRQGKKKILHIALAAGFVLIALSAVVLFLNKETVFQDKQHVAKKTDTPKESSKKPADRNAVTPDESIGDIAQNQDEQPEKKQESKDIDGLTDSSSEEEETEEESLPDDKSLKKDSSEAEQDNLADMETADTEIALAKDIREDSTMASLDRDSGADLTKQADSSMESEGYLAEQRRSEESISAGVIEEKSINQSRDDRKTSGNVQTTQSRAESMTIDSEEEAPKSKSATVYQKAVNAKNNGNLNRALRLFSRVQKGDKFYWDAKWQIANIHRSRGDTVQALKVYSTLKDTNNPHKNSAEFFYDLLDKEE
ncbi:MAG: hypothetical protein ACQES1_02780 [Bacteroidota bacterium]